MALGFPDRRFSLINMSNFVVSRSPGVNLYGHSRGETGMTHRSCSIPITIPAAPRSPGNWTTGLGRLICASHLRGAGPSMTYHFIDAMTNNIPDDELARRLAELDPDVVGTTAITPSIYKAENVPSRSLPKWSPTLLRVIRRHPRDLHVQAGPCLEAPWIDVMVRGEGEEIFRDLNPHRWRKATGPEKRAADQGVGLCRDAARSSPRPAAPPTVKDLDAINHDWSLLEMEQVHLRAARPCAVAIPTWRPACPFTCSFMQPVEILAATISLRRPQEGGRRDREPGHTTHQAASSILADEGTHHQPQESSIQFCEELIARGLPDKVKWRHQTPASPTSCA